MQTNWSTVITPIVSVLSIFISHWLGTLKINKEYKHSQNEKLYKELYIQLFRELNSALNEEFLNYHWLIAHPRYSRKKPDFLSVILNNNLEKIPPKLISYVSKYKYHSANSIPFFWGEEYDYFYYNHLKSASELFDYIIIELLLEAQEVSKIIKYPNSAKEFLNIFQKAMKNQDSHSRCLPSKVRKHKLKHWQLQHTPRT
ncbi:hypothetical protein AXE85_05765 [Gemella sp. oral taxon 928]|uniref:hypothetical protein n=1 Tax=Gemella sp. oral taxon 928 TaxID=1785995 RepID=UPI000768466C|nr:hypothetical protein [Gemella sp. oral taxon 928]AME09693.1 hypothetical protein AXE85_05765 [Gemella sp. oral taxon 928]